MVSAMVIVAVAVLAQSREYVALMKRVDSVAVSQRFSGVVVIGASAGDMDFARAYGPDYHVDTKFSAISMIQPFMAVAVARLRQDGKVAYDTPVARYLPDDYRPHERTEHITIRQLLTHTAGVDARVLDPSQPLAGDTGHFDYGNADYFLLAYVIQQVSGHPYKDYIRDHVFAWANMSNTGFNQDPAVTYTNAIDLLLFANTLLRNPLPGLFTDTVPTGHDGPSQAYGYGFFVGKAGRNRIIHDETALDIYPDLDVIVVVLSEVNPAGAQTIRQYIRDGLAALPVQR